MSAVRSLAGRIKGTREREQGSDTLAFSQLRWVVTRESGERFFLLVPRIFGIEGSGGQGSTATIQ